MIITITFTITNTMKKKVKSNHVYVPCLDKTVSFEMFPKSYPLRVQHVQFKIKLVRLLPNQIKLYALQCTGI